MTPHTYRRLLAARILSEANDLKRTPDMLAADVGLPAAEVTRMLTGECETAELLDLVDRIALAYPVDGGDLTIPEDDCEFGVRIVRVKESEASARIAHRADPDGETSPYYEYRDTAFSRLSPFRPEWIRQLRLVEDADPHNPAVVFNNGHLLHQYTYYVGGVNFYYRNDSEWHGAEMQTGDSTYGTPWWPHTFTTRDRERQAYILALTFGSHVRRVQRDLYALGARARQYVVEYRRPRRAAIQLLDHHLAAEMMSRAELIRRCAGRGVDVAGLFDEDHVPASDELAAAAGVLSVDVADLRIHEYTPDSEVLIVRRAASMPSLVPDDDPRYRIWRMARLSRMPQVKGFGVDVLSTGAPVPSLCTGLHTWLYNYGEPVVSVAWNDGDGEHLTEFDQGDSMYLQPFVAHGFSRPRGPDGTLCIVRVPGAVDLATQRELSYLSEVDRVFFEDRVWY